MKKNEFDFAVPSRQSYVAILMILYKTFNFVFRQALPIVVVVLLGGSEKRGGKIVFILMGIALVSMLYSILNFFRSRFYVKNEELIFESGVFSRKKTLIPFEKIQTINFEQNIIHRFFNVTRLKIDTAGSVKNEFEFHAIDENKASALRDLLLSEKSRKSTVQESDTFTTVAESQILEYSPVMSLTPFELLKVGITENHLKSGGLILIFFFWIYQNLNEAGLDVDEYSNGIDQFEFSTTLGAVLALLFLMTAFMISLIRTVVNYYDLRMLRSAHGFKIESGLLTKKAVSALDHKIQQIGWSDNLLRKLAGYKNLYLKQASSEIVQSSQTAKIPGCTQEHILSVVRSLYGDEGLFDIQLFAVDFRYFIRQALILSVAGAAVSAIIYVYAEIHLLVFLWLFILYMILSRYLAWRKKKFGFNESLLRIEGGIFGDQAEILPIYKIQALELSHSPYQRRNELTDLIIHTASGRVTIPYIPIQTGTNLLNLFLYKTETDHRKWM
jgi:putative membrane protein